MNYIQAQIWLKNIHLGTWCHAVGPAKMTEGFRDGHYIDHKASLLFLLLVYILKGFTSGGHRCSVTSRKHFHSENVGELWQMAASTFEMQVLLQSVVLSGVLMVPLNIVWCYTIPDSPQPAPGTKPLVGCSQKAVQSRTQLWGLCSTAQASRAGAGMRERSSV